MSYEEGKGPWEEGTGEVPCDPPKTQDQLKTKVLVSGNK
jgi:hypothetical protein